jgi:4-hydroxybenzoate polyprenyltransferase
MPQAVLGIAFSFGIPMAFAACAAARPRSLADALAAVPAARLVAAPRQPVLGARLRHRVRDGRSRRRPEIGIKTSAITLGRFDVAAVMASYALFLAIWAALGRQSAAAGPISPGCPRRR